MTAAAMENLALLAEAPGGIERVRQLILDLAAQGTLAGTASASTWPVIQFSDLVTSFQNGVSSRGASEGIPVTVLRLADIKNGEVSLDNPRELLLDTTTIEKYQLADGDILVIRVNGSADLVGRFIVHGDSGGALHCDHFIRIRIDRSRAMPRYVKILGDCSSTRRAIQGLFVSTAGQKTVNQGHVGSLSFLLPPLAEQHRIVAKVDELMALCDRLEARQQDAEAAHARLVQALLDSLTQARDADEFQACWQRVAGQFQALFTTERSVDALKNAVMQAGVQGRLIQGAPPSGWRTATIDTFCTVQGGIQKTPLRAPVRLHFPYLRVANVQRGRVDVTELERYELAPEELLRWRLNPGDLLIVEGNGSATEIGRCAIWRGEVEDCVYQNHLMRVRPTAGDDVEYLSLYLNSPVGTAHMRRLAITTSGLFNLSVGKIRSIPVELPPQDDQPRIVAKVTELLALCDQLKARIAAARAKHAQLAEALVAQAVTT
jgi:type I restriction enzyme S subunit